MQKKALLLRVSMGGHVEDIKSGGVNTIRTLQMGRRIATLTLTENKSSQRERVEEMKPDVMARQSESKLTLIMI